MKDLRKLFLNKITVHHSIPDFVCYLHGGLIGGWSGLKNHQMIHCRNLRKQRKGQGDI